MPLNKETISLNNKKEIMSEGENDVIIIANPWKIFY